MTTILGNGTFRYEVKADWGTLPDGWALNDVAAVAVDKQDRVYVFNRGAHPMIVFDRDGNFLRSWGEGLFVGSRVIMCLFAAGHYFERAS